VQIISTSALIVSVIAIVGVVAAATTRLGARERFVAVTVSLCLPVVGGIAVVAFVAFKRWRRARGQRSEVHTALRLR
jgi:uncharacterized membrane protein